MSRGLRRSVLAIVLTLLAGQAFALSNACNQVNSDWSGGRTIAPLGGGQDGVSFNYSNFNANEEIFYSATSTNSSSDELAGVITPPYVGMTDDNVNLFEYSASGTELSVSGTQALVANMSYYPYAYSGAQSGVMHVTMGCRLVAVAPTVTAVSPASGPTGGNTSVVITGTGFSAANPSGAVKFGATSANYTIDSDTRITATSPAGSAGTIDVTVTTPGGTSATRAADQFTYVAAPTVTAISPASGPISGGTTVTITGTGFATAGAVKFGATVAAYTINSNTQITATSPAGTGTIDVTVTTPGGTSATTAGDQFTYVAPPVLWSVSPNTGSTAGGTSVWLMGTNFTGVTSVTFGGTSATVTANTGTSLTVTTPAHATGAVDVVVTTPGGSVTGSGGFTYLTPPTATSITPAFGSPVGGTSVTITGTNLTGTTSVAFDGIDGTGLTVVNANTLTVTTPAHSPSFANVVITAPGGTATVSGGFLYAAVPMVSSVSPASGPISGGTTITINGFGFFAANSTGAVKFGSTVATYNVDSDTQITATAPAGAAGKVDVRVTTPGGTSPTNTFDWFTYVGAPTVSAVSPASGPTAGGTEVTITGSGFADASVTNAVKFGATVATYTIDDDTQIRATAPAGTGTVDITVANAGGTSATGSDDQFTYVALPSADATLSSLTLSDGTLSPAFASGTQAYTATVPNGTAWITASPVKADTHASVKVNGVLVTGASSGQITLAVGDNTVTVEVTAEDGTTQFSYTVTVFREPQALGFSPAAGSTFNWQVGQTYSQQFVATGGIGPYIFTVAPSGDALPAGYTFTSAGVLSGVATATGNADVDITVTDSGSRTATNTYHFHITASPITLAPATGSTLTAGTVGTAYTNSVTASGGVAPYSYVASGSLPPGISVGADGSLSGTPTADGTYNFSIEATDSDSTPVSGNASYTLVIAPAPTTLTLSPAAGSLTHGTVGTGYTTGITAAGGTGPYSYVASGSVPTGMTLAADGTLSGTPTVAGSYSFTVTATDSASPANSGDAAYTLVIDAASTGSFTFSPASGSHLTTGMPGEAYNASVTATGGTGALVYSLDHGDLPDGVVLNISTGALTGPVDAGADVKDYTFTIGVRDGNGATGSANYTITVKTRAVTAADKKITVAPGSSPANVDLTAGATGGPFVSAEMLSVEPANAGTAAIVNGEFAQAGGGGAIGWYLKFTPNGHYSGEVRVGYRLTSALGISNNGTITYALTFDAAKVADDVDNLVHGFVQSRQNLIASSIKVPGLLERRQMANATDPVTARMMPSDQGMTFGFSTSLAQLEAARDNADGLSGGGNAELSPFNIWIDGKFLAHSRNDNDGKWGAFAMISAGADYLVTDKALVGLSVHYDRMTDPTEEDAELTGNGWLAGPNASLEIGKGVFWDTSLLYGGSSNDIDTAFWDGNFDTSRWLFDTSVTGRWNLDTVTTIEPKLRAIYLSETVDDYMIENDKGDIIGLDGFTEEQLRISLGAEIARVSTLENDQTLTRKFGGSVGYSAIDGNGMFGSISAGLSLQTAGGWSIDGGLLLNIEGDGDKSVGAKIGVSGRM